MGVCLQTAACVDRTSHSLSHLSERDLRGISRDLRDMLEKSLTEISDLREKCL